MLRRTLHGLLAFALAVGMSGCQNPFVPATPQQPSGTPVVENFSTPEHLLIYLLISQVNAFYTGVGGGFCQAFHTNALFPDAHAISQRASFAAVAALNGARVAPCREATSMA